MRFLFTLGYFSVSKNCNMTSGSLTCVWDLFACNTCIIYIYTGVTLVYGLIQRTCCSFCTLFDPEELSGQDQSTVSNGHPSMPWPCSIMLSLAFKHLWRFQARSHATWGTASTTCWSLLGIACVCPSSVATATASLLARMTLLIPWTPRTADLPTASAMTGMAATLLGTHRFLSLCWDWYLGLSPFFCGGSCETVLLAGWGENVGKSVRCACWVKSTTRIFPRHIVHWCWIWVMKNVNSYADYFWSTACVQVCEMQFLKCQLVHVSSVHVS